MKKIVIWILISISAASAMLIPTSYQVRTMNRPFREAFNYDGALSYFAIMNRALKGGTERVWTGHWFSVGSSQGRRIFLVVAQGRAAVGIAVPGSAPMILGGTTNHSFAGVHVTHIAPSRFFRMGTEFSDEMTGHEREQYNQWMASFNADIYSLSAPLAILIAFFGVWPLFALFNGPVRRFHRRRRGLCTKCGYNLTGNTTGTCPECGTQA